MYAPLVSVVVVSRGRPGPLMRCLDGLAQQVWPAFEVIVVACPEGCEAVRARLDAECLHIVAFDRANISQARNLGITAASGEIVAFIDDDAVAEPLWLHHLIAPFEDITIAAVTGFVLGRNGISVQWQAQSVDALGDAHPVTLKSMDPVRGKPPRKQAIKLEGTNMAVRRAVLASLGGFDPAFRFFLDDTDLAMRLRKADHAIALVPCAQVHHQCAASARRTADRRPLDLTEIAASKAVFLRKHAAKRRRRVALKAFRAEQRARLLGWMQRGPLGADDVARLLRGFSSGWKSGAARDLATLSALPDRAATFRPYPGRPGASHDVLAGRWRDRADLRRQAAALVRTGKIVTLILLSPGRAAHRVRFSDDGFWEQTGGVFGKSLSDTPGFQIWRRSRRIQAEARRVAPVRGSFSVI